MKSLKKVEYVVAMYCLKSDVFDNYLDSTPAAFSQSRTPGDWLTRNSDGNLIVVDGNDISDAIEPKPTSGFLTEEGIKIDNLNYRAITSFLSEGVGILDSDKWSKVTIGSISYYVPGPGHQLPLRIRVWTIASYGESANHEEWIKVVSKYPDEIVLNACNDYDVDDGASQKVLRRVFDDGAIYDETGAEYAGGVLVGGASASIGIWGATRNDVQSLLGTMDGRGAQLVLRGATGEIPLNTAIQSIEMVEEDDDFSFDPSVVDLGNNKIYYPHCYCKVTLSSAGNRPIYVDPGLGELTLVIRIKELRRINGRNVPEYQSVDIPVADPIEITAPASLEIFAPKKLYISYGNTELGNNEYILRSVFSGSAALPVVDNYLAEVRNGAEVMVYNSLARSWERVSIGEDNDVSGNSISTGMTATKAGYINMPLKLTDFIRAKALDGLPCLIPVSISFNADSTDFEETFLVYLNARSSVSNAVLIEESSSNPGNIVAATFTLATELPSHLRIYEDDFVAAYGYNKRLLNSDEVHRASFGLVGWGSSATQDGIIRLNEEFSLVSGSFSLQQGANRTIVVKVISDGFLDHSSVFGTDVVAFRYSFNPGSGLTIEDKTFFPINVDGTVAKVVSIKEK